MFAEQLDRARDVHVGVMTADVRPAPIRHAVAGTDTPKLKLGVTLPNSLRDRDLSDGSHDASEPARHAAINPPDDPIPSF